MTEKEKCLLYTRTDIIFWDIAKEVINTMEIPTLISEDFIYAKCGYNNKENLALLWMVRY